MEAGRRRDQRSCSQHCRLGRSGLAGAKLPENYQADGENMLAALEGKQWRRTKPLYWEWRGIETQPETWPRLAVRDGDWKLLMTFDRS
ncbi:MAG: hypothetical protein ACREEM_10430, partial [Blastocatellia bacterium]